MKAAVGSVVIVACVFGVAGWLFLVRWHSEPEPALAADPCALEEVACTATAVGRVVHVRFPSTEASGDSRAAELSVSCVGPLWDVGILFPEHLPSGWYVVRWESLAVASAPDPEDWSASRGFLSSREPERFAEVVLGRVPLSGGLLVAAFGAPRALVFSVSRRARFEASVAFDALRVRAVVGAVAVGCGRGEAADG